jgi:hypothetical protein
MVRPRKPIIIHTRRISSVFSWLPKASHSLSMLGNSNIVIALEPGVPLKHLALDVWVSGVAELRPVVVNSVALFLRYIPWPKVCFSWALHVLRVKVLPHQFLRVAVAQDLLARVFSAVVVLFEHGLRWLYFVSLIATLGDVEVLNF